MCFWFFFFLTLFVFTQPQQYRFDQSKEELSICIHIHLPQKDFNFVTEEHRKDIADVISQRLHCRTFERARFLITMSTILSELKLRKKHWFLDGIMPKQLKLAIREAVTKCIEINFQHYDVPRFDDEPPELAEFLDYILVDWSTPLHEMIRSPDGRSTLRRYAYAAGVRLMSALRPFSMDHDRFRRQLRETWMRRAQRYFDGSIKVPYLRYRFSRNESLHNESRLEVIYTIDNPDYLIYRESINFTQRNPSTQEQYLEKFFSLHLLSSRILRSGMKSILSEYFYHGMSRAEYYLESHIDQCYRIIFFILELQVRGIWTDGDDIFDENIPYSVLPVFIQEIVGLDEVYRGYLSSLLIRLERYQNKEFEECLSSNSEEDLIILLVQWILRRRSNITSTTTSSTLVYEIGLKKGGIRLGECGKYLLPNRTHRAALYERKQQKVILKNKYFGFSEAYHDLNLNDVLTSIKSNSNLYEVEPSRALNNTF